MPDSDETLLFCAAFGFNSRHGRTSNMTWYGEELAYSLCNLSKYCITSYKRTLVFLHSGYGKAATFLAQLAAIPGTLSLVNEGHLEVLIFSHF